MLANFDGTNIRADSARKACHDRSALGSRALEILRLGDGVIELCDLIWMPLKVQEHDACFVMGQLRLYVPGDMLEVLRIRKLDKKFVACSLGIVDVEKGAGWLLVLSLGRHTEFNDRLKRLGALGTGKEGVLRIQVWVNWHRVLKKGMYVRTYMYILSLLLKRSFNDEPFAMCTVHVVKARKERFASFTGVFLHCFSCSDWMPQHVWLVHTCCGVAHTVQWLRFSLTGVNHHCQVFYTYMRREGVGCCLKPYPRHHWWLCNQSGCPDFAQLLLHRSTCGQPRGHTKTQLFKSLPTDTAAWQWVTGYRVSCSAITNQKRSKIFVTKSRNQPYKPHEAPYPR
jgi:hypothetical protein